MPRGESSRSGPAPDPNALRRERGDDAEWFFLPAEGRKGKAPKIPLPSPTTRERALWTRVWKKPQAVAWERFGQLEEVALYVRRYCESEQAGAPAALGTLVHRLGDSLGLTTSGMHRNRWVLGTVNRPAVASPAASSSKRSSARSSMRDRFQVVDGGA